MSDPALPLTALTAPRETAVLVVDVPEVFTITLADCTAEASQTGYDNGLYTLGRVFGIVCESTDIVAVWQVQGAGYAWRGG